MWNTDANSNGDAKPNTYCYSYRYAYTDSYAYGNSNSYSHAHGDALSDAYVPARRYAWSVDTGSAGGDRSLRRLHGQRWDLCL